MVDNVDVYQYPHTIRGYTRSFPHLPTETIRSKSGGGYVRSVLNSRR